MMMIRHNVPTLALCRALVSIHAQCNDCASALPSASETWLYRRVSGLLIRSGQAQTEEEEEKVEEEERAKKKKQGTVRNERMALYKSAPLVHPNIHSQSHRSCA